jgi:RNA polymerase sigma-70 factor (ECF subfamily)
MAMLLVLETLTPTERAVSLQPAQVNGYPALILRLNGEIDTVMAVRIDDGLITGLYAVRNPEKLSRMEQETAVSR